jgi:hypothetical protein
MTEAEWLACDDPMAMALFLQPAWKARERKRRLFGVACCRRVWDVIAEKHSREAVEVAEQYADGDASHVALFGAEMVAREVADSWIIPAHDDPAFLPSHAGEFGVWAAIVVSDNLSERAFESVNHALRYLGDPARPVAAELAAQARLARDIFGNPFCAAVFDADWRTTDVVALAQACYSERRLPDGELHADCLAVLADALEEAGCTDANLLDHLRSPGPHVRGCWALDLILGKS